MIFCHFEIRNTGFGSGGIAREIIIYTILLGSETMVFISDFGIK